MQLADWHVMQEGNDITKRLCVYGSIDEYDESYTQISIKDWTAEDMAEITSGLLEDVNKHSECNKPHVIVELMKSSGINEVQMTTFMRNYMKHMFQTYGY